MPHTSCDLCRNSGKYESQVMSKSYAVLVVHCKLIKCCLKNIRDTVYMYRTIVIIEEDQLKVKRFLIPYLLVSSS